MSITVTNRRSFRYAAIGFFLGIMSPIAWITVHLILFPDPALTLLGQISADITRSTYQLALYTYMGGGTALVMAALGYYIGKAGECSAIFAEVK